MNAKDTDVIKNGRLMLKPDWDNWDRESTDQTLEKPAPQKVAAAKGPFLTLPAFDAVKNRSQSAATCMEKRRSKRKYTDEALALDELAYLAWAANGVREIRKDVPFRTYPSGGNTQALDLYIYINNVTGLEPGLYRYLPLEPGLEQLPGGETQQGLFNESANTFNAQAVFIWAAVPYRAEYRYSTVAHKMIAMEAGHACQNLYLAAESIDMGCVAIAAFSQANADALLGIDGEEQFVIYMAAAGR